MQVKKIKKKAQIEVKIQTTLGEGPNVQKFENAFRTESENYPFALVYDLAGDITLEGANRAENISKEDIPLYEYQVIFYLLCVNLMWVINNFIYNELR